MEPIARDQIKIKIPWGYVLGAFLFVVSLWFAFSPPRFWINLTKRVDLSQPVRTGEVLVNRYECRNCHILGGSGGWIAPSLNGVAETMERETLETWLRDPKSIGGPTVMPDFTLSDSEIKAIIAYLETFTAD